MMAHAAYQGMIEGPMNRRLRDALVPKEIIPETMYRSATVEFEHPSPTFA